ncbi:MAG: outer membrane beta-barrel domain-containing protein [Deltaproteobacteria bacterium]|nr:outer membrane beta-barrel domain-containing protein [Deltaproteobacteria bacterium]
MKSLKVLALIGGPIIAALVSSSAALASDGSDVRVAIQERRYNMAHEFSFSFGSMPLDPFQKGWTGGFSYTLHLSDYVAWEMLNAKVALLSSTDLRDELIDTFAVSEDDFAAPKFMVTTGVEFSPIYGKMAFLNDTSIHQAAFVGAHAGLVFGDRYSISETLKDFRPAAGIGVGYRIMFSKLTSLRIDFRDFLAFRRAIRSNESVQIENILLITGAISFNLWRDDA